MALRVGWKRKGFAEGLEMAASRGPTGHGLFPISQRGDFLTLSFFTFVGMSLLLLRILSASLVPEKGILGFQPGPIGTGW